VRVSLKDLSDWKSYVATVFYVVDKYGKLKPYVTNCFNMDSFLYSIVCGVHYFEKDISVTFHKTMRNLYTGIRRSNSQADNIKEGLILEIRGSNKNKNGKEVSLLCIKLDQKVNMCCATAALW
jgi:hypothetical protein